jgi:GNAT superfamily N-acetyltransferase
MLIKTIMPKKDSLTNDDIHKLSELINNVYNNAEFGMWKKNISRTTPKEIKNLIQGRNLIVAYFNNKIVGAVAVKSMPDKKTGEFGMLVADKTYRGQGIGSALVDAAESWARSQNFSRMRLELLTPKNWEHPSKTFLKKWYNRIGYVSEKTEPFELMYPEKTNELATQCNFTVWYKPLHTK